MSAEMTRALLVSEWDSFAGGWGGGASRGSPESIRSLFREDCSST